MDIARIFTVDFRLTEAVFVGPSGLTAITLNSGIRANNYLNKDVHNLNYPVLEAFKDYRVLPMIDEFLSNH
jgi:hypothetical protein